MAERAGRLAICLAERSRGVIKYNLEPCPFCEERESLSLDKERVTCSTCGCQGPTAETKEEAIERWNGRGEDGARLYEEEP